MSTKYAVIDAVTVALYHDTWWDLWGEEKLTQRQVARDDDPDRIVNDLDKKTLPARCKVDEFLRRVLLFDSDSWLSNVLLHRHRPIIAQLIRLHVVARWFAGFARRLMMMMWPIWTDFRQALLTSRMHTVSKIVKHGVWWDGWERPRCRRERRWPVKMYFGL